MSQFDEYAANAANQQASFQAISGGIAAARNIQPPQPLSARIGQALTLAESIGDQLGRIADGIMGSEPMLNAATNGASATIDPPLTHKVDHLMQALNRINRQAERLNSAF